MERLISEFNAFFAGKAEIMVNSDRLQITIDSKTMIISLPEVIGGQNRP